jgi:hypothetical protein
MAFRIDPYPGFSWSITRQRMLDTCPRQYYYRYYLSHNGWLDGVPERSRLAYRLTKLTSLDAILGQEMDERGREIEVRVRAGEPRPSAAELEEKTRLALRAAWKSARDGRAAFERSPKRTVMLRSFYLENEPPDKQETDRVNDKIVACTANLLAVPDWQTIAECAEEGCVLIPDFAGFVLDEVTIFAAADLAYRAGGVLHVIDWKSGRRGDTDSTQALLSAYCAGLGTPPAELDAPADLGALAGFDHDLTRDAQPRLRPVLHYLFSGESVEPAIPADLEQFARDTVAPGIRAMRDLLLDPLENAPLPENEFARRESGLCNGHCNFSLLCEAG